jgi:hypothetical protein
VDDRFRDQEKSTLEQILQNPAITGYASGDELSKPQRGLVATTVSLMQDLLIRQLKDQAEDLRASLEEQRVLLRAVTKLPGAIATLYRMPMFQRERQPNERPAPRSRMAAIVTWGNFLAVAGLVIASVAIFFTKAYSSYKDRAESLSASLGDATSESKKLHEEKVSLAAQLQAQLQRAGELVKDRDFWKTTADLREKTVQDKDKELKDQASKIGVQQDAAALSKDLETSKSELQSKKDSLATLEARMATVQQEVRGAQEQREVFRNLFEQEQKKTGDRLGDVERLQREIGEAKARSEKFLTQLRAYRVPVPQ